MIFEDQSISVGEDAGQEVEIIDAGFGSKSIEELETLCDELYTEIQQLKTTEFAVGEMLAPKQSELSARIDEETAAHKKRVEKLQNSFETQNARQLRELWDAQTSAFERETILRELLILLYRRTGEKSFGDGRKVQVRKERVWHESKAIDWCIRHNFPEFLKIQKGSLGKLVTAGVPDSESFVEEIEKPTAAIHFPDIVQA